MVMVDVGDSSQLAHLQAKSVGVV